MPIKPLALYRTCHNSNLFSLAVKYGSANTKLIMKLMHTTVNTRELPHTVAILRRMIPSVLKSTCYNEDNYPFFKEVQHTEIGHLFEHILIELICLLKVNNGYDDVEVSGVTKWNWVLYPKGTFHITISVGEDDTQFFTEAMQRTIDIINIILLSGQQADIVPSAYHVESTGQMRVLQPEMVQQNEFAITHSDPFTQNSPS
jgi:hypothetical protein